MSITPFRRFRADLSEVGELAAADMPALHRRLAHWNHRRLNPAAPTAQWREDLAEEHAMRLQEGAWIET